jgi:hypothetical protein
MNVKEGIMKRTEELDEAQLLRLERELGGIERTELSAEEEGRLWRELAGVLSDPEDYAAFEELARRRPLF